MNDKTEAQPEALRLAAEFEDCIRIDAIPSINDVKKSAAELRRQHAEIQQLKAQLSARQAAPDEALRDALVRARDWFESQAKVVSKGCGSPWNLMQLRDERDAADAALSAAPPPPEREPKCWCETCRPITISDTRMVLCPDCGNKRCPKATHHDNACTNSNAPGQPGSSWEHVKPHGATNDNP